MVCSFIDTVEHLVDDAEKCSMSLELSPYLPLPVTLRVDHDRRLLHSRLHTAGHLLDIVLMDIMNLPLAVMKAYHFPDGPHIMYGGQWTFKGEKGSKDGSLAQVPYTREEFLHMAEDHCNRIIKMNPSTIIKHASPDDDYAMRWMSIDGFPREIACGGTHVPYLSLLGPMMRVRKVQVKPGDGTIRVSYNLTLET